MKINMLILFLVSISGSFLSCSNSKEVIYNSDEDIEFKVVKASYFDWFGGAEKAQGTTIKIVIDKSDIKVDSIYFRNEWLPLDLRKLENGELL